MNLIRNGIISAAGRSINRQSFPGGKGEREWKQDFIELLHLPLCFRRCWWKRGRIWLFFFFFSLSFTLLAATFGVEVRKIQWTDFFCPLLFLLSPRISKEGGGPPTSSSALKRYDSLDGCSFPFLVREVLHRPKKKPKLLYILAGRIRKRRRCENFSLLTSVGGERTASFFFCCVEAATCCQENRERERKTEFRL